MKKEKKQSDSKQHLLYAVLRLIKTVEVTNINGSVELLKIQGIEGYIPVYATEEEAIKASDNGKYIVVPLKLV